MSLKMRILILAVLSTGSVLAQRTEVLDAHNAVRSRAGVPPLAWSNRLAAHAQQWAELLISRNEFRHRPHPRNGPRYGENLFEMRGAHANPAEVVSDWASEARHYDYQSNSCRGVCGHFTQLVWRDTKEVGCAVARGGRREVWVCNYDPPGNYVGRRPY